MRCCRCYIKNRPSVTFAWTESLAALLRFMVSYLNSSAFLCPVILSWGTKVDWKKKWSKSKNINSKYWKKDTHQTYCSTVSKYFDLVTLWFILIGVCVYVRMFGVFTGNEPVLDRHLRPRQTRAQVLCAETSRALRRRPRHAHGLEHGHAQTHTHTRLLQYINARQQIHTHTYVWCVFTVLFSAVGRFWFVFTLQTCKWRSLVQTECKSEYCEYSL